ncbi:thioredoxin fold domain-containing protein [Flavobacterium sp. J49]|uniref:rhodanese-like domain-containing protein n=1 Tax=Flavobacterium sp. J49 TaxID=2718534 RepID=UPI001593A6A6|nr:rhodanese-like domain-containing protein [Flavobacterium sp. J49]MBF6642463.1 thioredoxin fold domain-containing protein [Flavobacterium sp. J49]NIC03709.1 thioredoxin fold domain-containing protein [Flavobacterium sp. J49]
MKSKLLSLLLLSFLFLSCQGQTSPALKTVDVKTFADKLNSTSNPQLLDVRTPAEFSGEHIDNAVNVNWNGDDFVTKANAYDKTKPIFVYCKVGGRSAQAANKLVELGFKEVYNLDGGIMKWNASGKAQKTEKIIGICDQEYNELVNSSKRVMVDFNAKWCAPCIKMNPYILKLQTELKDQIKIVQLDADENKTIVDQLKLDGLPVIIVYENGQEVWRNLGYISEEELRKHL